MTKEPTLHPNGFVQFDLTPDVRLHIWSPRLPEAQVVKTPIHDHTFNFRSRVLCGSLHHDVYAWVPNNIDPGYTLYAAKPWLTGLDTALITLGENGDMTLLEENTFTPGGEYVFKAGWFHESYADGLTATVCLKTRKHLREAARVAVPFGQEPDNDFSRYQTKENITPMFEIIEEVWPLVPVEYKV